MSYQSRDRLLGASDLYVSPAGHPGCIVASYCYQDQLFSNDVRELNASGVRAWRARMRKRLDLNR